MIENVNGNTYFVITYETRREVTVSMSCITPHPHL